MFNELGKTAKGTLVVGVRLLPESDDEEEGVYELRQWMHQLRGAMKTKVVDISTDEARTLTEI